MVSAGRAPQTRISTWDCGAPQAEAQVTYGAGRVYGHFCGS